MFKTSITFIFLWCLWLSMTTIHAQPTSLTIQECYTMAREHYPLSRQRDLISQSEAYSLDNASKGNLPHVSIYGQATYQSDVPHLPIDIPGQDIPLIPKDQYKVYGEVTQIIYNGGATGVEKKGHEASSLADQQKIEVELYKLRERINQLFFGILLINEQLEQTAFLQKDIKLGIAKIQAAIDNGTALKSSTAVLQVELLKSSQRIIEFESTRSAYYEMLGLMINQTLTEATTLVMPAATISSNEEINRPELTLYDYQRQNLALQNEILDVQNRPKINLFLQGGFGRPGLNLFDNQFAGYYIGGLRVYWPLTNFYSLHNYQAMIGINQQGIDLQKETFLFNTHLQVRQQNNEINKLEELLVSDDEIVVLRTTIKNTALSQLENGIINTNDYLREVNAEDNARQSKIVHEIQLRMAQYALQTTTGN